jgi:hypothetical protein
MHPALHLAQRRTNLQMRLNNTKPFVPLKSLKCAIVVVYNPDHARQATHQYSFPPTASTPEITLRVFRGEHTALVPVQLSGPPPDRFYDVDSDDESVIFELPFHPCERNFLISPPVGWDQTYEEPPNELHLAEDLHRALEQLRVRHEQEQEDRDRECAGGVFGDMSESEDGILLIPEGEAGACCAGRAGVIAVTLSWLMALGA